MNYRDFACRLENLFHRDGFKGGVVWKKTTKNEDYIVFCLEIGELEDIPFLSIGINGKSFQQVIVKSFPHEITNLINNFLTQDVRDWYSEGKDNDSMNNDEVIQWIKVIRSRVDNINLDDPKDFNDVKHCCDDLILKLQGKNDDTKWEYWKV